MNKAILSTVVLSSSLLTACGGSGEEGGATLTITTTDTAIEVTQSTGSDTDTNIEVEENTINQDVNDSNSTNANEQDSQETPDNSDNTIVVISPESPSDEPTESNGDSTANGSTPSDSSNNQNSNANDTNASDEGSEDSEENAVSNEPETANEPSTAGYNANTTYLAGDIVTNVGNTYQCLVAGWCSSGAAAYEPGVGFASDSAWLLVAENTVAENQTQQENNTAEESSETEEVTDNNSDENNSEEGSSEESITSVPATVRNCLPDGLYITPGTNPNLCAIYDADGREIMADDHPRRVIGYFTSWRTGYNDQPAYLVNDIPWDKITHINYAFAHVDVDYKVSIGDVSDENNPATGLTWETVSGAEMDSEFSFKGHFNLLAKYKKQYPDVKTLISVGGWAETGGHFDDDGRNADGGFYTLTIKDNGDINYDAINTFADSAVEFLRTYHFDGVDIDYEYPTSMAGSGNPDDVAFSEPRRAQLWAGYMELMKTLRAKLDVAGEEDDHHYMLTIASPSSGYLLRGMEAFQAVKYLDYVNIMSYDLHGAWNEYVGPNAALFDDGKDAELAKWDVYSTTQYDGIGYLNTDWAYHYFRGAMAAGRINIGIPYYTRGWQNVSGGTNGLWGTAPATNAITCPAGTGNNCGYGAQGIDNLWHDLDADGNELFAGSNPMWHAMNLKAGISGSYLAAYGLNQATEDDAKMQGEYGYHYDDTLVASWLWNNEKKVFLSIEDETSFSRKLDWVIENGIGGVMFWELAGDYDYDNAKGEYFMGQTLTNLAYTKLAAADKYGDKASNQVLPEQAIDLAVSIGNFANGDSNYPITPKITITNNSYISIPGGSLIEFDMGTSTSADIVDQSGMGLMIIDDGSNSAGNNIGGFENDHHRVQLQIPNWQTLSPGSSVDFTIRYYLPAAMPSNWTVNIDGEVFVISQEQPNLPVVKSL